MYAFIDAHHASYGVEPSCRVLEIAPLGYFMHRRRLTHASQRSALAQRDAELIGAIQRVYRMNREVYGPRRVWRQLVREGVRVARCTVDRRMGAAGL